MNNRLRRNAQRIEAITWNIEQRAEREITSIHRNYLRRIDELVDSFIQRHSIDGELDRFRIQQPLLMQELMEYVTRMLPRIAALQQSGNQNAMAVAARINANLGRVTRLEALRDEIEDQMANMFMDIQSVMESSFRQGHEQTYYRASHSIAVTSRLGIPIPTITNSDWLQQLLYNWSGETYDNRLWNNRNRIMSSIWSMLSAGANRGSLTAATREIRNAVGWSSLWQAIRILRTESVFFNERGNERANEENEVQWYEIIETLDERTCEICQPFDGQVFRERDRQQGVNAPTFHPNCRGCTAPHFPEEEISEWRRARDEDNNGTLIPGNMTYQDWFERFVS